jgi:coproporphyrinogen III oxidase-like Fe-S oxidoreductase
MLEKLIRLHSKVYGRFVLRFKKVSTSEEIYPIIKNLTGQAALYVHIPFCKSQCKYCTFLKFEYNPSTVERYFVCLKKELDIYLSLGVRFSEIYIGGGTPTINLEALIAFIDYAKEKSGVKDISVETILEDVNEESLHALKQAGVTRLSIGLQSIHQSYRALMERKEINPVSAREKINLASATFDTVNIDLIFNLPGQTMDELKQDIDFFLSLNDVKGTFYPLMPTDMKQSGIFSKVDLKKQQTFYFFIKDTLRARGFEPLTTWCFSKNNKASSEYIINSESYIGIGCGSISQINRTIYINTFSLDKYCPMIKRGLPVVLKKDISARDAARYRLLLSLFGTKIEKETIRKNNFHLLPELFLARILGLVKDDGRTLRATRKGMYYIGFTMREFFNSVADLRHKGVQKGL